MGRGNDPLKLGSQDFRTVVQSVLKKVLQNGDSDGPLRPFTEEVRDPAEVFAQEECIREGEFLPVVPFEDTLDGVTEFLPLNGVGLIIDKVHLFAPSAGLTKPTPQGRHDPFKCLDIGGLKVDTEEHGGGDSTLRITTVID